MNRRELESRFVKQRVNLILTQRRRFDGGWKMNEVMAMMVPTPRRLMVKVKIG